MGVCCSQPARSGSYDFKSNYAAPIVENVLFFPDGKMPCRSIMGGNNVVCKRDVCVFTITCNEIADEISAAHKRGVRVRIITDDAQRAAQGSDVDRLKAEGIAVRDDGVISGYMHHKFAILDKTILLNGSFNWTRHAVLGNYENIVVSNSTMLCSTFQGQFEELWLKFDKALSSNLQYV
ncbi:hypothetical protein CYMTET_19723 [Cymbomonas tetramitiformis]|uniref:Mitochondrial cardiolipin hydrolase n=1 Tax=Cymbomonas tetramitiformis TaxID=36881 RepID=A0AAE0G6R4_9CHLO|nr:hypothetical protein CYMTET_19723 [Cymbomonas tetramitiformis]